LARFGWGGLCLDAVCGSFKPHIGGSSSWGEDSSTVGKTVSPIQVSRNTRVVLVVRRQSGGARGGDLIGTWDVGTNWGNGRDGGVERARGATWVLPSVGVLVTSRHHRHRCTSKPVCICARGGEIRRTWCVLRVLFCSPCDCMKFSFTAHCSAYLSTAQSLSVPQAKSIAILADSPKSLARRRPVYLDTGTRANAELSWLLVPDEATCQYERMAASAV
jgi:hypothetical protein